MSQFTGQTRLAYSRTWHAVNLSTDPRPLGRLATAIAIALMGKHKPIYDPSTDCGDYVVAVGCTDLRVTGKKRAQKMYYSHTTRPGSLKSMSLERMMGKWGGGEVLRRAAHPYKENIVRLGGKASMAQIPEVKAAFAQQASPAQ
ncbi:hypothetical protein B0A54_02206 [Friedmanniomyces endolithicus]|uniref:Ribosomal protein L13 n=1 Tax=Friedmanniomyces endolithicus TaxID=329885 RepID=A0A4U0VE46_9PEZI|nr:hypothetical protein B0A54_02206 [Friedmanniomyces endolithicus]